MKKRQTPSGVSFFDRTTGLNILFDEVAVPSTDWSVVPRHISIAVTNSCELACPFCYAPKHAARIEADLLVSWALQLDEAGCLGMGFGGGEPTLYPAFASLCKRLRAETHLALSMTTHGHRFTPSLVDSLSSNIDFIRVSMDGLGSNYEKIRGRSFDEFLEKLSLVRRTARFGINFVITDATIDDLPRAAELVFELGATEIVLLPERNGSGQRVISEDTQERLADWIEENYSCYRIATSSDSGAETSAPTLPVADPRGSNFDYMHIDASRQLKFSSFRSGGVQIQGELVLKAIDTLLNTQASMHQIGEAVQ